MTWLASSLGGRSEELDLLLCLLVLCLVGEELVDDLLLFAFFFLCLLDLDLLDGVDPLRFALPLAFCFLVLFDSFCALSLSMDTALASSCASLLGEEACVVSAVSASSFSAGEVGAEAVAASAIAGAGSTGGFAEPQA